MNSKVRAPKSNIAMMRTPIFEYYVVRRGSKNDTKRPFMCLKKMLKICLPL